MPRQNLGTKLVAVGGVAAVAATTAVAAGWPLHAAAPPDRLTVYAATSLANVLPEVASRPAYSFGGSNTLRLQIERGARADVFLAAEPGEAQALYREGRCERPVTFATNRLVLIVPRGDPAHVGSVAGLARGGLKVSVGNPGVPVGAYARRALARLKLSRALDANVVSQQANVGQVLSQVAFGAADAGFVYVTDARSERDRVRALAIPAGAQPAISYEGCVVKRAGARTQPARALLGTLRARRGRTALERLGFGLPARG